MTSKQTGDKWLGELLRGHPVRFHNAFRMTQEIFFDLLGTLEQNHGLQGSRRTASREVLAITLYVLSHNECIRKASERFQHSTETASRYFSVGIRALVRLAEVVIVPEEGYFDSTPPEIAEDTRYMPFFKDCIGAIDGTHVHANVPVKNQVPYIGRHGTTTQNIMAACDFNMCFTFAMTGWEGSAHDSRIFNFAISDPKYRFPHPPRGKFYLVDAGYPLQRGYIKPFPDTRYHLPDFARGNRPVEGLQEIFNQSHSSLRSVIERTFGVWKKKWAILRDMPSYSFTKQKRIVLATIALHNFIRRHPSRIDPDFRESETISTGVRVDTQRQSGTCIDTAGGVEEMIALRDSIAQQLYESRR
ncbi:hypothetical protein KSP39_PZI000389 [Platanthera zijinensis]|uniref:DDE Tnp4 domain-containing protein n=1 Tax=Platanthera zijinensis TaxID=2320716 RepID=A0AAP0C0E9_9ASPA